MPSLDAFVTFVRKRVADPDLAADIVQDSLLKAIRSGESLRDEESTVAWFYRILRHSIIDVYRRQAARKTLEAYSAEDPSRDHAEVCQCLAPVLKTLKPEYAHLVEEVDLKERSIQDVAAEQQATTNNLTVRLHRARKQLRERLEQTCQLCSKHGCLNCTCGE
jgi:RNA polymerase sigma factor (sigma-70 family)